MNFTTVLPLYLSLKSYTFVFFQKREENKKWKKSSSPKKHLEIKKKSRFLPSPTSSVLHPRDVGNTIKSNIKLWRGRTKKGEDKSQRVSYKKGTEGSAFTREKLPSIKVFHRVQAWKNNRDRSLLNGCTSVSSASATRYKG